MQRCTIKPPACWSANVSTEIYHLLLLFSIISSCYYEDSTFILLLLLLLLLVVATYWFGDLLNQNEIMLKFLLRWEVGGGDKKLPTPSLKIVTHIPNDETWHSCTLPKEDPKNIWIPWHTPWVLLTFLFFHLKSVNFAKSRNTVIYCILILNF